jgi:NAD(P)-dependent dehydrogenase (short-subunit alcohol dehydrogenase family)
MISHVWLVTGAGRGLGRAIAQAALEAGHQVVATARNSQTLDAAFGDVPADRLLRAKLDVTDLGEAQHVAQTALGAFGRVDVLVNNAGYGQLSAFEENFASIGGYGSSSCGGVYLASKFAVVGLTESLAAEVAEFGISATVVAPGYFRTDFLDPSSARFGGSVRMTDYTASTAAFRQAMADVNHAQEGDQARPGPRRTRQGRQATREFPRRPRRRRIHYRIPQHVLDEIAAWRGLSETTSYDEASAQPR